MCSGVWGGGRQQWGHLHPQHRRRLHRHLHRDRPRHRHSCSWILVNPMSSISSCPPFPWGLNWLVSHGVWFLLVLSRYYKYKAPSTRVSSVEVRTNKQIFFGREDVSEYFATLFPPLRSRRERRKTTEHLSSGITRKTFLESKTRLEVLKFLRNRSFEIS